MRDASGHLENFSRADDVGSISASLDRENNGRLRRVEGTESESAFGSRACAYALWGRMSRISAEGSESTVFSADGGSVVKALGGRATEEDAAPEDDAALGRDFENEMGGGMKLGVTAAAAWAIRDGFGGEREGLLSEMRGVVC